MDMVIIFLGLLPSFVWLGFFLQEDIHPEPRKMIFVVFLMGIIAAVFAVAAQYILQNYLSDNGFWAIAAFAAIEEISKFIFTYLSINKSKYFDEPVDAMIYMVTAASGMAAFENVALMMSPGGVAQKMGVLVLRFLGATLLHVLSSSVVGFYWAKGVIRKKVLAGVIFGLILATLFHTSFNYLIKMFTGGVIYSILFLVASAFFIFYDFEKLKNEPKIID